MRGGGGKLEDLNAMRCDRGFEPAENEEETPTWRSDFSLRCIALCKEGFHRLEGRRTIRFEFYSLQEENCGVLKEGWIKGCGKLFLSLSLSLFIERIHDDRL